MVELGELERNHAEFAARGVRVVVISNDVHEAARSTQADFPHLKVVSDADENLARAIEVIHPRAGQNGEDTNAPTTLLVDGKGAVRWIRRPRNIMSRLSPQELLAAIDETLQRPR
jgi:peroxiredoxin